MIAGRLRPGLIAAVSVLALYGAIALAIDVPRTTFGIHSDEATYYLLGHSIADDGDLEYRHEDLVRAMAEYPGGPSGVFLKKGHTIDGQPDPDPSRLYYGKSFVYPLIAAPFVKVFGTNGFLLLNAVLLAGMVLAAYAFLSARSPRAFSLIFALAFVFATIVPVYAFWIAPEVFNCAIGMFAYFCWLYKHAAPEGRSTWLRDWRSDALAGALLGLLTFSKVSNALLVVPVVLWLAWKRQWKAAILTSAAFWIVTLAFFGANIASSGEWNYQGGERRTFYAKQNGPGYAFEQPGAGLEVGEPKARDTALWDIIFDRRVFFTNLRWNALYIVAGRHAGLIPYFFPAVFAMAALIVQRRRAPAWQWFVFGGGVLQMLFVILTQPYTWNGSGGSVGNRYFMTVYGIFLFILPAMRSTGAAVFAWAAGALFTSRIVLHPFYYSYNPDETTWRGPLRALPIERTLVNDLPMNTDIRRVRILFGSDPRFQVYYLDDNAFFREPEDWFWIRGDARADLLIKTDQPVRTLQLELRAGPVPSRGAVRFGWKTYPFDLPQGGSTTLSLPLGAGFPYQGTRVWTVAVSAEGGFVPQRYEHTTDDRYLGVKVRPVLLR